jgi:hypothetical protein
MRFRFIEDRRADYPVTTTVLVQNGVIVAFECPSQPPSLRCCDDRLDPPRNSDCVHSR